MKILHFKLMLVIAAIAAVANVASAYDFIQGGIAYEKVAGSTNLTVVSLNQQGENYPGLAVAQIPPTLMVDGVQMTVTMIGQSAFNNAKSLVMAVVPSTVSYIGDYAFSNCQSLVTLTLNSGLVAIGNNSFSNCVRLSSVSLPETVITIGNGVFYNCTSLKTMSLPKDVLMVGEGLLDGCTSLSALTIPSSLTELPARMARGCSAIKTLAVPNSITSIGDDAFNGCSSLATLTLGDAVETIGTNAFAGTGVKSVKIPNATTSIGNGAFNGCTSLAALTFGNAVETIGNNAFNGTAIKSLSLPNTLTYIGDYAFPNLPIKSLSIPGAVSTIGAGAFKDCAALESLTLPASVTSVGENAFAGCEGFDHVRVLATAVPSSGANMLGDYGKVVIVPTASKSAYARSTYWCFYEVVSEQEWSGGCDINSDGNVDVGDVNSVLADILATGGKTMALDVNGDGKVDVGDVNRVLEYILTGEGEYKRIPLEDETYTVNGVKFTMKAVDGGVFMMGQQDVATPVHQVKVPDFLIGETEVTQELWQAVMGSNPSSFTGNLQRPVERVSWSDCQTFITKLNELTGETFRLPTEAEWEFAARGGSKSEGYQYSGSDNIDEVAWYTSNSGSATHAVKTKTPNELGLYDMSGNVWEWCQDWYGNYSSAPVVYPTGPATGSDRVYRGGSWINGASDCRVAYRGYSTPSSAGRSLGLRLAR